MHYERLFIAAAEIPTAISPAFQHLLDTYASETNKTAAMWAELGDAQLGFRPHPKSTTLRELLVHQLLSERRFFAEFIGLAEPPAAEVLPPGESPAVTAYVDRLVGLARPRLAALAPRDERFWLEPVPFFDVTRERIWVFWRRVLHSAHHRAQAGFCLRLLGARVPSTYGPTADVSWSGADPTRTVAAAERPGQ
ncbi:MAG TPA: DinB family protein [Gemmatimonadales bacterium]|nr:DinB family protein [Gemmatimonadales bacterium]